MPWATDHLFSVPSPGRKGWGGGDNQ